MRIFGGRRSGSEHLVRAFEALDLDGRSRPPEPVDPGHPEALRWPGHASGRDRARAVGLVTKSAAHAGRRGIVEERLGRRDRCAEAVEPEGQDCATHPLAQATTLELPPEPGPGADAPKGCELARGDCLAPDRMAVEED